MKPPGAVFGAYGTTIFEEMSHLAREEGAINLGQGFPDAGAPDAVIAAAATGLTAISNQYPPMWGIPELRQAVAAHNRRFYGLDVDWARETLVVSGATEALAAALLALLSPGDEAVVIEPLYDTYVPIIRLAGAVARPVRLQPPHWDLPIAELAAAFSDKTKLILVNSPMNPCGKVFSEAELAAIAGLCRKWDAYAVCDEVYEHLTFDGHRHLPLISFPGMRERTLRIGSAGKTFSLTGWKIGYLTGAAPLIERAGRAHQFLTFTTPPNLQWAVAQGLALPDAYFTGLGAAMQAKRDRLAAGLAAVGFAVLPAQGTYFLTVDFRPLGFAGDDRAFVDHITRIAKVAAIPVSVFYEPDESRGPVPRHFARFCVCKQDAVLDEAIARLARHFAGAPGTVGA